MISVEATKTKDGRVPDPMAFVLRDVDLGIRDEDGMEITSAVLDDVAFVAEEPKIPPADQLVLDAVLARPDGVYTTNLAATIGKAPGSVRAALSRLGPRGLVEKRHGLWFPVTAHEAHESARSAHLFGEDSSP